MGATCRPGTPRRCTSRLESSWRWRSGASARLSADDRYGRATCSKRDSAVFLWRTLIMLTRRRLYWSAALLLTSGVLFAAAQSATLPADLDPQSRARLPYLQ